MQTSFLSHVDAATRNRNNILRFVKNYGPISRTEIWEQVNISRASVTQIIKQLEDSHLIMEVGDGASTGGRKPRYIAFNGDAKTMYAFDWGSQTLALITLGGTILYELNLGLKRGISPMAFATEVRSGIDEIRQKRCGPDCLPIGLGIALPGLIDSTRITVLQSIELGWQNVCLQDLFPDTIFLERTGNVMAMGEHAFGASKSVGHFQLFILSADGIGVSTIIHDSSQHGANFMHGELGHIKLPINVICSCGQRGCLEAVVGDCMMRSGGEITDDVLEYLSIGISTAVNISDPGAIVLVGSYVDAMSELQRMSLIERTTSKLTGRVIRKLDIHFNGSSKELSLKGLSALGFDRCFAVE